MFDRPKWSSVYKPNRTLITRWANLEEDLSLAGAGTKTGLALSLQGSKQQSLLRRIGPSCGPKQKAI
jgi:hypothetical protein